MPFLSAIVAFSSCKSQYEMLLNSNDADLKYEAAFQYFNDSKFTKAASLFESMSVLTGGTERDDTVQYYWGLSNYRAKDFYKDDVLVIDQNLKGLDFTLARCCNPIYGDDVFGFVSVSGGIKIHRCDCPNAKEMHSRFPYRIVRARWAGKSQGKKYPIRLRIVGHDDIGIVTNITSIINKETDISLRSISIDSNDGLFSGMLTVMVDDTSKLEALVKKIKTVKGVKQIERS